MKHFARLTLLIFLLAMILPAAGSGEGRIKISFPNGLRLTSLRNKKGTKRVVPIVPRRC